LGMTKRKVMGASKAIHRRNLIYQLIYPYTRIFFFQYYGKVEIRGRENIPRGQPVIFAPNHQQALMDALIVLFAGPEDVVFLARADIFNKPLLAYLLNSLKILPVFRQRDGATELGKNEEIFSISVNVLKNNHQLCVMPEGNHGHQRRLRVFGKGIFRIAFEAQKEHGSRDFVKIVPVGLDFGDYVKQHSTLFVNFGKPIEVSQYWEQYEAAPPRAINEFKKQLISDLRPLMVDIQNEEFYEAIHGLRTIFNDDMRQIMGITGKRLSDRFRADKEMIARLDALIACDEAAETNAAEVTGSAPHVNQMRPFARKVERYLEGVKALNVRDWVVRDKGYGFGRTLWRYLTLLVTFPVFLYGFLTSIIPYWLPVHLVRNIKDRQFHSSVKAGLGILVLFPVWYLLLTLLVGIFTGPWWIWAAFLVSLLPAGKAALYWYFRWKKTVHGSRFRRMLRRKRPEAVELVSLREQIIAKARKLVAAEAVVEKAPSGS